MRTLQMCLTIFFKSVFKLNADVIPHCDIRDVPLFRFNITSVDEMLKELNNIKLNTSTGSEKNASRIYLQLCPTFMLPIYNHI